MSKNDWTRPANKIKGKKSVSWHWDEVAPEDAKHERMVKAFLEKKDKEKKCPPTFSKK